MERDEGLILFLSALAKALDRTDDPRAAAMVGDVFARLDEVGGGTGAEGIQIPVCRQLDAALEAADRVGGDLDNLAHTIRTLAPRLVWRIRAGLAQEGEPVTESAPGDAMIIGPGGLVERSDVWIGMSLLAPGTLYPDHRHPPPEVYLALTAGQFRHDSSDWFTPGVGGTFFNTPNIVHAMRAEPDAPLLAIWLQDVASVAR